MTANPALTAAAQTYNRRVDEALATVRGNVPMLRRRVVRELIREQAAESDVANILAAALAGLKDCAANPGYATFARIATEEIEQAMTRISARQIAHLNAGKD